MLSANSLLLIINSFTTSPSLEFSRYSESDLARVSIVGRVIDVEFPFFDLVFVPLLRALVVVIFI